MKPNSEPPTYQLSADRKYLGPHILTCQINSIREDPPKVCSEPECRTKPGTEETHSGYLTLPLKKKSWGIAPWVQMGGIIMTSFHKQPCWGAENTRAWKYALSPSGTQPCTPTHLPLGGRCRGATSGPTNQYRMVHLRPVYGYTVIIRQGRHCRWNTV